MKYKTEIYIKEKLVDVRHDFLPNTFYEKYLSYKGVTYHGVSQEVIINNIKKTCLIKIELDRKWKTTNNNNLILKSGSVLAGF